MKKCMLLVVSIVTVFALNGCGGVVDDYYYSYDLTTLFLIDQNGLSLEGVPYTCDSRPTQYTAPNGEFSFYPGENCTFDFLGLADGNYNNDPITDDIIYIVDYLDYGKGGIPYDCASFVAGTTYGDGSFEYDIDDVCVFYL